MKFLFTIASFILFSCTACASDLIEFHMNMPASVDGAKRVALTFDACMGKVDERILQTLIDNKIKATIFVTARWLKYNTPSIAIFKAHPELFEIENHGAQHVAAVDEPVLIYGRPAAGDADAVTDEINGGAAAVKNDFDTSPGWFRGAAAEYTESSMALIKGLGFRLAGFTFSGDGGAMFSSEHTAHLISTAKDGDVILMHINQPGHAAGKGVVQGILELQQQGFNFVTLDEGFGAAKPDTPPIQTEIHLPF